jgi:hypothetical protein
MPARFAPAQDGLIHSEAIEINAVQGCNLSCRACSHTSPVLSPRAVVDPESVRRDLTLLARSYRCEHVRILGGEPLLHPDLPGLVAAIRASGICDRVRVVTNGVLLSRQDDRFWQAVDELHVSVYPGHEPSGGEVERWRAVCAEHGVQILVRRYNHFRESYSEIGSGDADLVARIYRTCLIAHVWLCHNVVDGVFYKCPQSHFLAIAGGERSRDGVPIADDAGFRERLLAYLNDDQPLRSCQHCLGAVGQRFPHEEIRRQRWRGSQRRRTEDLLDHGFLARLENEDPAAANSCIASEEVLRP